MPEYVIEIIDGGPVVQVLEVGKDVVEVLVEGLPGPPGGGGQTAAQVRATTLDFAPPSKMLKLPLTIDGRAGFNNHITAGPLWTEAGVQYAVIGARINRPTPAVPTVTYTIANAIAANGTLTVSRAGNPTDEEDVQIVVIAIQGATANSAITPEASNGWEQIGFACNSGNVGIWAFKKIHTTFLGTVGTPYNFTRSADIAAQPGQIILYSLRSADPGSHSWHPVANVSGTGTAVALPIVTTLAANSLLISAVASAAANSVTPATGYTEQTNTDLGGAAAPSLETATFGQVAVGISATATATLLNSAAYAGLQFAIGPMQAEARPMITRRILPDGPWDAPIDLSLVASNTLLSSIDIDEHNTLNVARAGDGRVYVVGNMHNETTGGLRMIRTQATDGSVNGLWDPVTITGMASITYAQMIRVTNGDLLLIGQDEAPAISRTQMARLTATTGLWSASTLMCDNATKSAYLHNVAQDPNDPNKIAVIFVWSVVSSADGEQLSYFGSSDGGLTWKNAAGAAVGLPVLYATTAGRNADVIDAATDINRQSNCCIGTDGVVQCLYQKDPSGGQGAVSTNDRYFHAFLTGTSWTIRQLPYFTYTWRRPRMFAAPNGRVFALANGQYAGMRDEIQVTEVSPSVTQFDTVPIASWTLGNSELPIDRRAALMRGELHVFISSSVKMFTSDPDYADDLQWILQKGYVLSVAGSRMWEIQRDLFRPLGVEVVASARSDKTIRVSGTTMTPIGPQVEIDRQYAEMDLMVRAHARGSVANNNTVLLLALNEHADPSTDSLRAKMTFSSVTPSVTATPWVPLSTLGTLSTATEGFLQFQAMVQPTSPLMTSGIDTGDPGYGVLTAITIEVGRVRT